MRFTYTSLPFCLLSLLFSLPPSFSFSFPLLSLPPLPSLSLFFFPHFLPFTDTAFMFIISGLLIIKIVQARHPDLYYNAFITLLCLAVIVLLTFIGIVSAYTCNCSMQSCQLSRTNVLPVSLNARHLF